MTSKTSHTDIISITPEILRGHLPKEQIQATKEASARRFLSVGPCAIRARRCLPAKPVSRAGVGYLSMAIPSALHPALAGHIPEAIWQLLPEHDGAIASIAATTLAPVLANKQAILIAQD